MATSDGFHPDFDERTPQVARNRVHHVKASEITSDTAQSGGLQRFAALSGSSVGAEKLWMGETHVSPESASDNHHHGESETGIYIRSGNPEFVFHDGDQEVRIRAQPGDYIFVPPYLPHREENPDPDNGAEVVIARSTQEAIVVNLPALYPL
jgi:uncharacterized RmlC-like cupin family protein